MTSIAGIRSYIYIFIAPYVCIYTEFIGIEKTRVFRQRGWTGAFADIARVYIYIYYNTIMHTGLCYVIETQFVESPRVIA